MGKLLVVEGDPVQGTDKHNVSGSTATSPSVTSTWVGDYDYRGSMTDDLSDFVRIDGAPVAVTASQSSLDPGEDTSPTGGHSGPTGKNYVPPAPAPVPMSLQISDPIGVGNPSASAGSRFVSVGGDPVLLDGDKIDTCDGLSKPMNSTVTASNQSFVSASEG
jgi:uncharacterized Zn-binding protein involved in type VI secretion